VKGEKERKSRKKKQKKKDKKKMQERQAVRRGKKNAENRGTFFPSSLRCCEIKKASSRGE
jgi:hypothetical protein